MGQDKALMTFGAYDSLSQFQLSKFNPYFKNVYISSKDSSKFSFEANFIDDLKEFKQSAPIIAIVSIFERLDCKEAFILSVDAPNFNIEHFMKLYKKSDKSVVMSKSPSGFHPLCAIYKKEVLSVLKQMIKQQNYRMHTLFDMIDVDFVEFQNEEIFKNLNYQKDLT